MTVTDWAQGKANQHYFPPTTCLWFQTHTIKTLLKHPPGLLTGISTLLCPKLNSDLSPKTYCSCVQFNLVQGTTVHRVAWGKIQGMPLRIEESGNTSCHKDKTRKQDRIYRAPFTSAGTSREAEARNPPRGCGATWGFWDRLRWKLSVLKRPPAAGVWQLWLHLWWGWQNTVPHSSIPDNLTVLRTFLFLEILRKARSWTQHLSDWGPKPKSRIQGREDQRLSRWRSAEWGLRWQVWVGVAEGVAAIPSQALRLNLKSTYNITVHDTLINVF